MNNRFIYGDRDPRDLPAYTVSEAARYLRMPPATLRSWVRGRTYPVQNGRKAFEPLISLPDPTNNRLSFTNLTEAHVLRALRKVHEVPVVHVRTALDYAARQLGIERLLLSDDLMTYGRDLFLERYGQLINLSKSGQIVLRKIFDQYLKRVERSHDAPIKLYPFLTDSDTGESRPVVIDPTVSFGKPTLADTGIRTSSIVKRIDAGESIEDVANDYNISTDRVEEALMFERAA